MSKFFLQRKIRNRRNFRTEVAQYRYESYAVSKIDSDMDNVILSAYNNDVYGVEIVR